MISVSAHHARVPVNFNTRTMYYVCINGSTMYGTLTYSSVRCQQPRGSASLAPATNMRGTHPGVETYSEHCIANKHRVSCITLPKATHGLANIPTLIVTGSAPHSSDTPFRRENPENCFSILSDFEAPEVPSVYLLLRIASLHLFV